MRGIPVVGHEDGQSANLFGMHCGDHLSVLYLVIVKKRKEEGSWTHWYHCTQGPKELAESVLFSLSKKGDVHHCVMENPWTKKVGKLGAQASVSCNSNTSILLWRHDIVRKMTKRLQNMLNLSKSIKRAKEKSQEQIAKRWSCPLWQLLPLSVGLVKRFSMSNK